MCRTCRCCNIATSDVLSDNQVKHRTDSCDKLLLARAPGPEGISEHQIKQPTLAEPRKLACALGPPKDGTPARPWNKVCPVTKSMEELPPKLNLGAAYRSESLVIADPPAEPCSRPTKAVRTDAPQPRPLALELCAGHAGYTALLWDRGFEAIRVDWTHNR